MHTVSFKHDIDYCNSKAYKDVFVQREEKGGHCIWPHLLCSKAIILIWQTWGLVNVVDIVTCEH